MDCRLAIRFRRGPAKARLWNIFSQKSMENFSTARRLACCLALAAGFSVQAQQAVGPGSPLPEHDLSPQLRELPFARPTVAGSVGESAWPRVIVLHSHAAPYAEVQSAVDGAQLFITGQILQASPASALHGVRLFVYRPGPWLEHDRGGDDPARLAFRVGRADVVRVDGKWARLVVADSDREIIAGDLVLGELPRYRMVDGAVPAAQEIDARVAAQRGDERLRFAAAGQVVALDRGARDGVLSGMCLHQRGRRKAIGRILHVGTHASAAQLARVSVPLEAGDEISIRPCTD